MRKHLYSTAAVLLALSACTMTPDYERPGLPVDSQFRTVEKTADKPGAVETGWRDFFQSAELRHLIGRGLQNNRDLREAVLNIEAARAEYRIQRSDLVPAINASGTMTRQRVAETLATPGSPGVASQYDANIGFTAYEVDLFGRVRSLNDAAVETYLATEEARHAVQVALIAEIANAYLTLLADREQLELSRQTVQSQQESYNLARRRLEAGIGTQQDLRQVETLLETAKVDEIAYTRQSEQDRNALELLIGAPLDDRELAGRFADAGRFVSDVRAGLPSDLLQNRPDIRQAEHTLRAANANIGAARAAFFPTISLTAAGGTAGTELSDLFAGGSRAWSFVPQITIPIFTGGRNTANLDLAHIRKEISVVQYERAIQTAFREVSDALTARQTLGEELAAQNRLVAATEDSYKIAQARYERGIDNYLAVLDARRSLYAAQQGTISKRLSMLANYVTLYAALGGGQR